MASTILDAVKKAHNPRITTTDFDDEINDLIQAALLDLGIAGVTNTDTDNYLIRRAVITYVRLHFGEPDEYERIKASYDEQKAQLSMATDYTDWSDGVEDETTEDE